MDNLKIIEVKRLDHLPLVSACTRHLEIAKTIVKHSLGLSRLHFDATSLSLYGEYNSDEENPLVTFGYSKEHRPDLKQILFGMTVTQDGNVPIQNRSNDIQDAIMSSARYWRSIYNTDSSIAGNQQVIRGERPVLPNQST